MTDTDHGRLPEEYWIRHITHHRMCARLSDAVPVRGIRLYFPAPHEPRAASGHGSDRTQRARAAVGPLLKILRTLCTTIDLTRTPYHARTRPLFRRGSGNTEKAATAASELE